MSIEKKLHLEIEDLIARVDEAELEIGILKQAYNDLKKAIPVQALTVFLDWWEDPDNNDIPSYDDFMAVAALVDRMRES